MKCKICGNTEYTSVINLGNIYPSNFISEKDIVGSPKPLHLVKCNTCSLVQLKDTYDLDEMYRKQYWYRSSLNPSMKEALQDIVTAVEKRVNFNCTVDRYGDEMYPMVLDIGCNDGTLLSLYNNKKLFKVGIDPAPNVKEYAEKNCIFINDYFSYDSITKNLFEEIDKGKYSVITAIAMFYDLDDPNSFLHDISLLLADDGLFVLQFTDLYSMIKCNAIDNICHEHFEYYSLCVLDDLLTKHGLQITDVEYNQVNGGSIRLYIKKYNQSMSGIIEHLMQYEYKYFKEYPLETFGFRVLLQKAKLLELLANLKLNGKTIYALGASTKGNTLLQSYGLNSDIISKALEVNKDKFGLKTVGSNIPIISEDEGLLEKPDYLLVLPWHYKEFFIKKFESNINDGLGLIFPLPEVEIVKWE